MKSQFTLLPVAMILLLGCNTAEKRGEKAYAATSRLHSQFISVMEQSMKVTGDQGPPPTDRQKLEDLIKEVRINRKGDELVQASLNHCGVVESLANGWINDCKGNLESAIHVDMQSLAMGLKGLTPRREAQVGKVMEARILSEQSQLDQANRVVAPVVAFLPEIQKAKSEILDIGSKQ
jgi:hypothetical protein